MIQPIISLKVLGQYEKPIIIHKFRTMYVGADKDLPDIVSERGLDDLGKIIDDPRVIVPWGKIMRRYFIDELPQIYDLNRGVLSLVGIRAKTEEYWKLYPEKHKKRALRYKPGLFGVPYYYTNLRDFKDCVKAEEEYLTKKERENNRKLDKEYIKVILTNVILKGLRSK